MQIYKKKRLRLAPKNNPIIKCNILSSLLFIFVIKKDFTISSKILYILIT